MGALKRFFTQELTFNITTRRGRIWAWLYSMLQEHNFTNLIRFNFHRISDDAYRSSQPTMWQLRRVVKNYGIKTILNLKGSNPGSAYYAFEKEQCEKLGITMIDVEVWSREMPRPEDLHQAEKLFASIQYPMWMHCKAGADRTGIYATLFQYFHQNIPIEKTNQLRFWPFGHIKGSKAGKIDNYLEHYLTYRQTHPEISLMEWADNIADRDKMNREYRTFGLADFINEHLLRRE